MTATTAATFSSSQCKPESCPPAWCIVYPRWCCPSPSVDLERREKPDRVFFETNAGEISRTEQKYFLQSSQIYLKLLTQCPGSYPENPQHNLTVPLWHRGESQDLWQGITTLPCTNGDEAVVRLGSSAFQLLHTRSNEAPAHYAQFQQITVQTGVCLILKSEDAKHTPD